MIELDTEDLLLLCALREDSRQSLRDLGAKAHLSAPAVASRIKRLEQSQVITSYTINVAASLFSLEVEAILYVKVRESDTDNVVDYIKSTLAVSSLYKIGDEYQYMLIASFKNIALLNDFYDYLQQNFGKTKLNLVLKREIVNRQPFAFEPKLK